MMQQRELDAVAVFSGDAVAVFSGGGEPSRYRCRLLRICRHVLPLRPWPQALRRGHRIPLFVGSLAVGSINTNGTSMLDELRKTQDRRGLGYWKHQHQQDEHAG